MTKEELEKLENKAYLSMLLPGHMNSLPPSFDWFKNGQYDAKNYLIVIPNFEIRKLIAKCNDHELMFARKGKHENIDVEERLCYKCFEKRRKMSYIS